jgi:hypothetical protein
MPVVELKGPRYFLTTFGIGAIWSELLKLLLSHLMIAKAPLNFDSFKTFCLPFFLLFFYLLVLCSSAGKEFITISFVFSIKGAARFGITPLSMMVSRPFAFLLNGMMPR